MGSSNPATDKPSPVLQWLVWARLAAHFGSYHNAPGVIENKVSSLCNDIILCRVSDSHCWWVFIAFDINDVDAKSDTPPSCTINTTSAVATLVHHIINALTSCNIGVVIDGCKRTWLWDWTGEHNWSCAVRGYNDVELVLLTSIDGCKVIVTVMVSVNTVKVYYSHLWLRNIGLVALTTDGSSEEIVCSEYQHLPPSWTVVTEIVTVSIITYKIGLTSTLGPMGKHCKKTRVENTVSLHTRQCAVVHDKSS